MTANPTDPLKVGEVKVNTLQSPLHSWVVVRAESVDIT
jgi:hypothetical protein